MPGMDDPFDLRPVFREHWPSYGPDWDRAIDEGVDIAELERNLALTIEQRILQLDDMLMFLEELQAGMPHAAEKR